MKMYDVGHKMSMDMPMEAKPEKNRKSYPSLHICEEELPVLKGKDVGDKVNLVMECEIMGIDMHADDKKKKVEYRLEIKKAGEESHMKMEKAMEEAAKD